MGWDFEASHSYVSRCYSCGVDFYQNFIVLWNWFFYFFEVKNLWGAIFFVYCCFHFHINHFQDYYEMRTEVLVSLFVLMANAIVNMLNINISIVAHQFAIGSCKPGSVI